MPKINENLEIISLAIDNLLFSGDFLFKKKESIINKGYEYYVTDPKNEENYSYGIISFDDKKHEFISVVLDHNKFNYYEKEGFEREYIDQNLDIWLIANNVEKFIKLITKF